MDKNSAITAAGYFAQRLTEKAVRVSTLILFGSYGRGEATEDSDVDLLVVSNDFRGKDIFDRAAIICEAEGETIRKFMIPLDVIMMTEEEFESGTSPIAEAARTGTILFQKSA
jgi:uncharacterized protein